MDNARPEQPPISASHVGGCEQSSASDDEFRGRTPTHGGPAFGWTSGKKANPAPGADQPSTVRVYLDGDYGRDSDWVRTTDTGPRVHEIPRELWAAYEAAGAAYDEAFAGISDYVAGLNEPRRGV